MNQKLQKTPRCYKKQSIWNQTMIVSYVCYFDVHCNFVCNNKTHNKMSCIITIKASGERDFIVSCFLHDDFGILLKKYVA